MSEFLVSVVTHRVIPPFTMAHNYSPKAQKKVEKTMHEFKRGQLKSGRSGKTVRSRKQAIVIGLSKARKEGAKVPPAKTR